jgi:hypothetical protein
LEKAREIIKHNPTKANLALFIDIKDAYGSISWKDLLKVIEKYKIWSQQEVEMIKYLWYNTTLVYGKAKGKISRGLFQGSKISCQLFTVYLGDVIQEIVYELKKEIITTMYVDDIVLISNSEEMPMIYSVIERCFKKHGF